MNGTHEETEKPTAQRMGAGARGGRKVGRREWHAEERKLGSAGGAHGVWQWVQQASEKWERSRKVASDRWRNRPQNMQKPFPLSRKINNRFINKFYKAVQLFKAFW